MPLTECFPYTVRYTQSLRRLDPNHPRRKAFPIFSVKMNMKELESREFT